MTSQPLVQTCPTPPPEPDRFGGRSIALAKLCDSLERGEFSALTAVHGLGGIGKTTLATKAVNDLFKQKVFRAVLHAKITRDPDPVAILETWARNANSHYLRPANAKPEDIASNVKNLLEATINATCEHCDPPRILVFLDDVWSDADGRGKAAVKLLRQACPTDSTILLTTRFEGLAIDLGANPHSLDRLTPEEGKELLQTYPYLENMDAEALRALSNALGGHALALDLAAKRVGKTSNKSKALHDHVADYEKHIPLGEQFKILKLDQGDTREENLTLVLSYSYDDLSPDDQSRFRQLGIFPPDTAFDLPLLTSGAS